MTTTSTRTIQLPQAEVTDGRLVFATDADATQALRVGAFLVAIPPGLDLTPGLELCRNFYKPAESPGDRYRGHTFQDHSESKLGYADRPDQVEQLQLESAHWERYLPAEATALLREMEVLTLATLHGVMELAGVPEQDWDLITGGASIGNGWCHSTVNHYRSNLPGRIGIVEHTDSGFITLLYADKPGLEILEGSEWLPVDVQQNDFIVNLGDCLEILASNLPRPMTAVVHRVPESPAQPGDNDRSSFTVFMGPRYDMAIYQYDEDRTIHEHRGFRDFSVDKAAELGYEFHPRL